MAMLELKELPEGTPEEQVVKPVAFAKEMNIRPQIVYGWIRTGGLQAYTKGGDGRFLIRDEVTAWQEAKAQRKAEREAKAAEKAEKAAAKEAAKVSGASEEEGDEDYEG